MEDKEQVVPDDILAIAWEKYPDQKDSLEGALIADMARRNYVQGRLEERAKSKSILVDTSLFHNLLQVVGAKNCSGDAYEQVLLPPKDGGDAIRVVFRDDDIVVDRYSKADSVWTDEDMFKAFEAGFHRYGHGYRQGMLTEWLETYKSKRNNIK